VNERQTPQALETISVDVPAPALEAMKRPRKFCATVGFFSRQRTGHWRSKGQSRVGSREGELAASLALAGSLSAWMWHYSGQPPKPMGWLERSYCRPFPSSVSPAILLCVARMCGRALWPGGLR